MIRPSRLLASLAPALLFAAGLAAAWSESARGEPAPRASTSATASAPLLALPGPAPRGHAGDAEGENAACERCHAEEAAEWRGSMHRDAFTDPVFQEALAIEPAPFCRGCHAPEADARVDPPSGAKAVGVGCTTCHVEGRAVVGVRTAAGGPGGHAVVGDARLAAVDACAGCHQFDFPGSKGEPMQNTVAEHAASGLASIACQGCHMPSVASSAGKTHKSHRFGVIGDASMIRSAADVKAARAGRREVRVEIAPADVGHSFPTGDMFRRLEVNAEALDAEGRVVERAPAVHLGRTFADRARATAEVDFRRVEVGDTRVPARGAGDGLRVALRFEHPIEASRVRWRVVYQRMATAMAASFGVEQARDEVTVAEGVLPVMKK